MTTARVNNSSRRASLSDWESSSTILSNDFSPMLTEINGSLAGDKKARTQQVRVRDCDTPYKLAKPRPKGIRQWGLDGREDSQYSTRQTICLRSLCLMEIPQILDNSENKSVSHELVTQLDSLVD